RTAVFANSDGEKVWAWGEALVPQLIVHDPELCLGLPRALIGATGMDALVHAVEAWTGQRCSPLVELFAAEAVKKICRYLPRTLEDPGDLAAHSAMLLAATCAGVAIDNGGTGVAHALGHALGTVSKIHHGRA